MSDQPNTSSSSCTKSAGATFREFTGSTEDTLVSTLFALFGFGLAVLWSWHNDPHNKFNLRDLVSLKGQVNEAKLTRFVAFIVSTWGFVFLMVTSQRSEEHTSELQSH